MESSFCLSPVVNLHSQRNKDACKQTRNSFPVVLIDFASGMRCRLEVVFNFSLTRSFSADGGSCRRGLPGAARL